MDDLFKKYYYEEDSILSKNELWNAIKNDKDFSLKYRRVDFDKWLTKQEDVQIDSTKNKVDVSHTHAIIAGPNSYQSDLMYLDQLGKINNNYTAIINFIEITSRKAYAYPLKGKTAKEVFSAFEMFLKEIDGKLEQFEIDKGSEYSLIIKYCKEKDINLLIYNNDKNSMAIVERFNRSLRNYIKKVCKNGKWVEKLGKITTAYNRKEHSALSDTPDHVDDDKEKQQMIRNNLIWESLPAKKELAKYKVGDKVRVYEKKKIFDKGTGKFSSKIYTITSIEGNSIFIDHNPNIKYRYYNVKKTNEVESNPIKEENTEMKQAAKNYKVARKLHKELGDNYTKVTDTDKKLTDLLAEPKRKRTIK
jgi:hypothetical protein